MFGEEVLFQNFGLSSIQLNNLKCFGGCRGNMPRFEIGPLWHTQKSVAQPMQVAQLSKRLLPNLYVQGQLANLL